MILQVYESLKVSGQIPPEKLAFFDHEEGASQLSYMRYLPVAARPATAIYIVDNNLDAVVRICLNLLKEKHATFWTLHHLTASGTRCNAAGQDTLVSANCSFGCAQLIAWRNGGQIINGIIS